MTTHRYSAAAGGQRRKALCPASLDRGYFSRWLPLILVRAFVCRAEPQIRSGSNARLCAYSGRNSLIFRARGKRGRLQSISARETCRNPVIEGDVGAFSSKHRTFTQDWLHAQLSRRCGCVYARAHSSKPKRENEEGTQRYLIT